MPPVFGESKSFIEYCTDLMLQLFILGVEAGNIKSGYYTRCWLCSVVSDLTQIGTGAFLGIFYSLFNIILSDKRINMCILPCKYLLL